jgi:glycosyltransferase involved in cell wall biosynthesis
VRVVLLSETFSRKTGYLENALPKHLVRLGVETHVVTADLPPYYQLGSSRQIYGDFAEQLQAGTVEDVDGYTLHILGHKKVAGYMRIVGLRKKLSLIRPDIIQTMAPIGWIPLDAALYRFFLRCKLFTGAHTAASGFPLAGRKGRWWDAQLLQCKLARGLPGRLVSLFTDKCYAVTEDCAEIAVKYFGVQPRKTEVMYLGVDTEFFFPAVSDTAHRERLLLREELGFAEDDIVCVYTGKFTEGKCVLILAQALEQLRSVGKPFRGLFVGDGPQRRALESYASCKILDFMPFQRLGQYYRAADIGVWPGNESTSMLDAAACGIPVVISDRTAYRAPVDGNGRVCKCDDVADLVRVLLELEDRETRECLGSIGAARMAKDFSWDSVARRRLKDYERALQNDRSN